MQFRINEAIRAERERAGLSKAACARALSRLAGRRIHPSLWLRWESGEARVHADMMPHIAAILGVTLTRLYGCHAESLDQLEQGQAA